MVKDPFVEAWGRGWESVPGLETGSRRFVPWLGGSFGPSRAGQAGGFGEQGPAEVQVVEDHQGFGVEALVGDVVFDPQARLADAGRDAAAQHEVRPEDAGLPDLTAGLQHAALLVPERVVGDPGRGDVRGAAVQAELLAPALARRPHVPQAAGDEEATGERVQPALPPGFVEGRGDDAVGGKPGQRRTPVLGQAQVHPAVGKHVEGEAAAGPETEGAHATGRAVVENEGFYTGDLLQPSYPTKELPSRQRAALGVCEHSAPPSRPEPGDANVGRIPVSESE